MMKQTPEPWIIDTDGDGKPFAIITSTHDKGGLDDDVCEVYGGNGDDDGVREANARLIASAPEMLKALQDVRMMAVCGYLDQFVGEPWLNAVFAVTAKAEGDAA